MTELDKKIDTLEPGQAVRISGDSKIWVEVERSGDGQTVRFVRYTPDSSTVFHTAKS
jgi:hypothetical protein